MVYQKICPQPRLFAFISNTNHEKARFVLNPKSVIVFNVNRSTVHRTYIRVAYCREGSLVV